MLMLRSILFYAGYVISLILIGTLCMLVTWALPLVARYRLATVWNRFVVWWLRITCGVRFRVTGTENVPTEPFVLLSNHQSPWETLFLYYYFLPLCAILKKELLRIPFFGWALALLKPIAIDRSKGRSALNALMVEGPKRLAMGLSVLVFPEGTRTEIGQMKKFFPGGAELAIKAGAVVLPVAHNAGACWPARKFVKYPGVIDVVIGKPIPTAGRESRELTEEVQGWIRQALPQHAD